MTTGEAGRGSQRAATAKSAIGDLPFIDEHSLAVNAPPEHVWDETAQVTRRWVEHLMPRFGGTAGPLLAGLLGCSNVDPPGPGAPEAIVGFRVAWAERPQLIALEGEHRFSRYALTFRIEPTDSSSCIVKAETRAASQTAPGASIEQR